MSASGGRGDARVLAVWIVFAAWAVAIVVTYSRVPIAELYSVTVGGARGGFGRALVFLNFPVALVAIALALISADRLRGTGWPVAVAAILGLCAVVVVPGVVDQNDLDAKLVNALPALGVLGALGLTLVARRAQSGNSGAPRPTTRLRSYPGKARVCVTDRADFVTTLHQHSHALRALVRPVAMVVIVLASVPWIAAELGFHLDGPFLGSQLRPEPGGGLVAAVHLGHHHGMDGSLLALTALVLLPAAADMGRRRLHTGVSAYLSLMLAYGLANAVQDDWGEQVVKRGWTDTKLPNVLHPSLSFAWLGILAAAAVAYRLLYRHAG